MSNMSVAIGDELVLEESIRLGNQIMALLAGGLDPGEFLHQQFALDAALLAMSENSRTHPATRNGAPQAVKCGTDGYEKVSKSDTNDTF